MALPSSIRLLLYSYARKPFSLQRVYTATRRNKREHIRLPSRCYSSLLSLTPTGDKPSISLALAVIVGLPLALWSYKCLMLVLFQRKIIYMGYLPPGVRTQQLDPASISRGIRCSEITLESDRGVALSGIEVQHTKSESPDIVMLYLQGNAGNPLGRIPVFTALLRAYSQSTSSIQPPSISIIAVAPRSYWKSTSRAPTQQGVLADYTAALQHALRTHPHARVILYGHSLGGAVATCLLATLLDPLRPSPIQPSTDYARVSGLILENPFASIEGMVRALYRSRWTPYRYLAPLAFDKWDAFGALKAPPARSILARLRPHTRVLVSEYDEVVPRAMGEELAQVAGVFPVAEPGPPPSTLGGLAVLAGAMHEDGWQRRQWATEMRRYLDEVHRVHKAAQTGSE